MAFSRCVLRFPVSVSHLADGPAFVTSDPAACRAPKWEGITWSRFCDFQDTDRHTYRSGGCRRSATARRRDHGDGVLNPFSQSRVLKLRDACLGLVQSAHRHHRDHRHTRQKPPSRSPTCVGSGDRPLALSKLKEDGKAKPGPKRSCQGNGQNRRLTIQLATSASHSAVPAVRSAGLARPPAIDGRP